MGVFGFSLVLAVDTDNYLAYERALIFNQAH